MTKQFDREIRPAAALRVDSAGSIDESIRKAFLLLDALDRRVLATVTPPLTAAQYHALVALSRVPGQSLGELAARMLCAKANASGIIDRLEALDLVSRTRNPHDARLVVLRLTSAGESVRAQALHARATALLHALAPAELDGLSAIAQTLRQLVALLEGPVQGEPETTHTGGTPPISRADLPVQDRDDASQAQAALVSDERTTAPGDLPLSEITARITSQRYQFRHDNTTVPLAPQPDVPVEIWATSGDELRIARATVFYSTDGRMPDTASSAIPLEATTIDWDAQAGYLTRWRAILPAQPAGVTVRYRIAAWHRGEELMSNRWPDLWAHDSQGFWFRYAGESGITTFAYHVEPPGDGLPDWVRDAVIYQIFLDRFHPGTPDGSFAAHRGPQELHGGTLRGVQQALPYLEELGVTCLWLSPFCPSPSYHRYDATDYYGVDPALGTAEDLRALTAAAHARGMRVMMDFVPSHCSWEHPAFRAAQRDPHAPTASWFTFDERPDSYRSFLGSVPVLPSFNTNDPGARAYLIESAVYWLREFGIDAFRLDHAIGPSMDFWVAFRTATRAAQPEVFSVGEATDTPDSLRRYWHRLDAVLDFPLARALRHLFALGDWDLEQFDGFLQAYSRYMVSGPGTVSFLDNHDMNRFLFLAGGDVRLLKLAALCSFTLEPTPAIYYGTEIALPQRHGLAEAGFGGDAQVRTDMVWDQQHWDHDALRFFRALIRLRREQPALRRGTRRTVHLDRQAGTYAYQRSIAGQLRGAVLSVFNLSDQTRTVSLPGHDLAATLLATDATVRLDAARNGVTLPPRTGAALACASDGNAG